MRARRPVVAIILLLAGAFFPACAQVKGEGPSQNKSPELARKPQIYTHEGISVEFTIEPVSPQRPDAASLIEGTEATVRFKIADANEGKAVTNLRPAAWMDRRLAGHVSDARGCREKVQSFLQPSFSKRPILDLNRYFILSLNHEANISVIDPLSGFGGSKLYTLVALNSQGEDWVMSADKKRLYVSMPLAGAVAVIDTTRWKVIANLDSGLNPTRLALQRDGRYLWVGNDTADHSTGGVTVIDTETLRVVERIETGAGHHEIAFAADDRFAFVTNKESGTLSIIDVHALARLTDIKVGALPASLAFSPLSKSIYVANEGDGTIAVIDGQGREGQGREILARMKADPGLRAIRISPDGRFGFAVNPAMSRVYIFDVSSNRLIHSAPVGPAADQVAFTREFAYVRSAASEFITMIKLADMDKETEVAVTRFPAGQKAPRESPASSHADAVIPTPENGGVLVANPADKMIYYYTEGMAAPMGSFQNYRRDPKALLVLDSGLVETSSGVYTTTIRLPDAGHYDMALLLDSPRLVNCFEVVITEDAQQPKTAAVAIRIEPLIIDPSPRVGERYSLRFRVIDSTSKLPKADLTDMGVMVFLAPGIWHQRQLARSHGNGIYEISFVPRQTGAYYVYFQCPSLGVQLSQITPVILQAIKR